MDTFEVEQRETLTRDEAATRLRARDRAEVVTPPPVSSHFPAHIAGFCELIRGQVGACPGVAGGRTARCDWLRSVS
jgi:hypothetical protein